MGKERSRKAEGPHLKDRTVFNRNQTYLHLGRLACRTVRNDSLLGLSCLVGSLSCLGQTPFPLEVAPAEASDTHLLPPNLQKAVYLPQFLRIIAVFHSDSVELFSPLDEKHWYLW